MRLNALPLAVVSATFISLAALAAPALASEKAFVLTLKDHRFAPASLTVPAGEAFELTVVNQDATAEEFESQDFHVEKVVAGGKQITVHVGPLAKGSYGFFGERHEDTAWVPSSELPLALRPGDQTATVALPGATTRMPPPTPLLPGRPTR